MTTQELKEYIGRVLGNSIRCLLPSYWWKRLFGLVVDKVEEVEGSIVTSIEEFAKNRPDIYERTFYLSEKAEHIAHNVEVVNRCLWEAMQGDLRSYYIATMIEEGPEIWWIRNDCYAPTYGISTFMNVEDGGNKYNVMFLADGTVWKVDAKDDSVIVDTEMSSTSENAVQNKVIKAYVDKSIKDYNQSISEEIVGELDKKVDKIEGKQLSTEDFTTALKTKLEGMSSFDPTEINNKIDGLQSQINTLVSGDASTAIESFNEIVAFLDGIEDSESLDSIIASIEQQIANIATREELTSGLATKQDKITDLETIRSGAALGATALQEHQDISHLATKEEVTSLNNEIVANEEVTAAALNNLNERIKGVDYLISGTVVTKKELQENIQSITDEIVVSEEVTAMALVDLNDKILAHDALLSNVYATKNELHKSSDDLINIIMTNEEVIAAALIDLNTRIVELQHVMENIINTINTIKQ